MVIIWIFTADWLLSIWGRVAGWNREVCVWFVRCAESLFCPFSDLHHVETAAYIVLREALGFLEVLLQYVCSRLFACLFLSPYWAPYWSYALSISSRVHSTGIGAFRFFGNKAVCGCIESLFVLIASALGYGNVLCNEDMYFDSCFVHIDILDMFNPIWDMLLCGVRLWGTHPLIVHGQLRRHYQSSSINCEWSWKCTR